MSLPRPGDQYDPRWAAENNRLLDAELAKKHSTGRDVELGRNERLIMRSPNGARWSVVVSDAGVVSATAMP